MEVEGSGTACGGECVGERVYVGWWGVVYAGLVEDVFRWGWGACMW
jgi:hypothetical protein